jgi:hypothetical protein
MRQQKPWGSGSSSRLWAASVTSGRRSITGRASATTWGKQTCSRCSECVSSSAYLPQPQPMLAAGMQRQSSEGPSKRWAGGYQWQLHLVQLDSTSCRLLLYSVVCGSAMVDYWSVLSKHARHILTRTRLSVACNCCPTVTTTCGWCLRLQGVPSDSPWFAAGTGCRHGIAAAKAHSTQG